MDARPNIKSRLPSRRVTTGPGRALHGSPNGVTGLTTGPAYLRVAGRAEIFKKTRCIPDSKSAGRDVAKDMVDGGCQLPNAELAERRNNFKPRLMRHRSGAIWKFTQQVGAAVNGAVILGGGAREKQCYADI